jgi:pyrroloquinoline quinone biosynthesis protein B
MTETIERFAPLAGRVRIVFTHLNHSNPAVDPASPEARAVREAGFEIASDGLSIAL